MKALFKALSRLYLRLYQGSIKALFEALWRRFQGSMKAQWRLNEGSMKALWRLYWGSMKALWRLYEGSMKALWRLYEGSMKALWRLSTSGPLPKTVMSLRNAGIIQISDADRLLWCWGHSHQWAEEDLGFGHSSPFFFALVAPKIRLPIYTDTYTYVRLYSLRESARGPKHPFTDFAFSERVEP
jgi:hypothetical protein